MNQTSESRFVIDEINTDSDGRKIATLVSPEGRIATIPLELLPDGARVNQVIIAGFRSDADSTTERLRRVRELQHRLFSRDEDKR